MREHRLWETLQPELPINLNHWLSRLGVRLKLIVTGAKLRLKYGDTQLFAIQRLERIGDFDALACLDVSLRMAIQRGNEREKERLSHAICRTRIADAAWLYSLGIPSELAEYIDANFLGKLVPENRYVVSAPDYLARAKSAACSI